MKTRIAALASLLSLAFAACGASFFVAPDKKEAVKKVAVVQYAINPHILVGIPNDENAKLEVAKLNVETFGKELGNTYQIVPASEVLANAAYTGAGGKPTWEGYYSATGMHYFSPDEEQLKNATLPPDVAKKLCEALGVDGVVAIYDSWVIQQFGFMNLKAHTVPRYTINLFDKDGNRVWGGILSGESTTELDTPPGGAVTGTVDTWAKANNESFTIAMSQVKTSIGAK
ncbi:MAG: hypothetical protein JNK82_13700 [Myxococcaceae bacterium]|nr:hypothetical protein [Myxococcaceae bacterium]